MTQRLRIAGAQINPVTGDIEGNLVKAKAALSAAAAQGADILMFPELFLAGYPAQDLVLRPAFAQACMAAAHDLAVAAGEAGVAVLIGMPLREGDVVYNAVAVLENGAIRTFCRKHVLPNTGVFDEKRVFAPAPAPGPVSLRGARIGVAICEDAWWPDAPETLAESGAEILLVPNGSPYERRKHDIRQQIMVARVVETGLPLFYLNMTGGQDDQVFDGGSFVLNPGGALALQAPFFEDALIITDWVDDGDGWRCETSERALPADDYEADYRAMVMGLGDYMRKSGFGRALLGLSGGIDSALVAAIAADAIGPQNVQAVMLPSRYTSVESLEDAAGVAKALGIALDELPIGGAVEAVGQGLAPFFAGTEPGVAEENIQSRLRGLYLMALSNKFGAMLLTTGNKSEVAVGYATLYGDMSGGYNPLKDLYKTRVFETVRWRNANHRDWMHGPAGAVIPPRVIDKPPSAELREDQKDEDSLPPYDVLDAILEGLVDRDESVDDLVEAGYERETVQRVEKLVYISEYKRFQSAPGVKLTTRAFWLDRRYPIVNRWRSRLAQGKTS